MGAQWKAAGKAVNAAKKGALVGKLTKEIIVAAKLGGPDPSANFRLRGAIEDAKRASVTRDTIERAIKRGAGLLDEPIEYETILYEGFAPHCFCGTWSFSKRAIGFVRVSGLDV